VVEVLVPLVLPVLILPLLILIPVVLILIPLVLILLPIILVPIVLAPKAEREEARLLLPTRAPAPSQHVHHCSPSLNEAVWNESRRNPKVCTRYRKKERGPKVNAERKLSRVLCAGRMPIAAAPHGDPPVRADRVPASTRDPRRLLPFVRLEVPLPEPDRGGRHLHELVVRNELERRFQRQDPGRLQDNVLIRAGRPDVRELLPLADVDLHVPRPGVLAHDHPLVDLDAGADEERPALLEVVQRVGHGHAVHHAHHDPALPRP